MPNISLFSFKGFNSRAFHQSFFEIKPSTSFSMRHYGTSTNDFRFPVMKFPHITRNSNTGTQFGHKIRSVNYKEESSIVEEDDENCPVDCVREFKTDEEFLMFLAKAKKSDSLVVVDFYRNSCGSCKYIEKGFTKLCKGSGDQRAPIIFLKHNVIDEYDEQTEVAERLRIRSVPLFQFYKDGVLLEAFPTRDKERILGTIRKYSSVEI